MSAFKLIQWIVLPLIDDVSKAGPGLPHATSCFCWSTTLVIWSLHELPLLALVLPPDVLAELEVELELLPQPAATNRTAIAAIPISSCFLPHLLFIPRPLSRGMPIAQAARPIELLPRAASSSHCSWRAVLYVMPVASRPLRAARRDRATAMTSEPP